MAEAVILDAVRAPFGRRGGAYRETRPDSLLAAVLQGLMARTGVPSEAVEDVVTGCVTQVSEQGANVGRLATLLAGFPVRVPAVTLDRMCGSSPCSNSACTTPRWWKPSVAPPDSSSADRP